MYDAPTEITVATQANLETFQAMANDIFSSVESMSALTVNTARVVFEDRVACAKALLEAKSIDEMFGLQFAMIVPALEKPAGYSGSVHEIAARGSKDVARRLAARFAELNRSAVSCLEKIPNNFSMGTANASAASCGSITHGESDGHVEEDAGRMDDVPDNPTTRDVTTDRIPPKGKKAGGRSSRSGSRIEPPATA